jgi:hypothetical protein
MRQLPLNHSHQKFHQLFLPPHLQVLQSAFFVKMSESGSHVRNERRSNENTSRPTITLNYNCCKIVIKWHNNERTAFSIREAQDQGRSRV